MNLDSLAGTPAYSLPVRHVPVFGMASASDPPADENDDDLDDELDETGEVTNRAMAKQAPTPKPSRTKNSRPQRRIDAGSKGSLPR